MKRGSVEKGEAEEISEINVVPLADVSLVLLIMLMLITPMVMQSMIRVYSSRGAVSAKSHEVPKEKPLFVEIKADGYYLNTGKMESTDDLFQRLRGELSRKEDRTVIITANKGVRHGAVVTALDVAKQAGAVKLSLVKKAAKS